MTSAGVLPFIQSLDLSRNDLAGDLFPAELADMTALRRLKLNRAGLERVPDEMSRLKNLEQLQMNQNALTSIHGELSDLPNLRSVIVRSNQIKTSGIPTDIFDMQDLTIIDFSHNALKEVPPNLDHARSAIVLNLSSNSIETIPNQASASFGAPLRTRLQLFMHMNDLLILDLSHNELQVLPPQMRRLTELQELRLSGNPLLHFQLKQLPSMTALRVLHMRDTQRNAANVPPTLDNLVNLQDVDLSLNQLDAVPEALYELAALRRLNLSDNAITSLDGPADLWPRLQLLNVSRNRLAALPDSLTRMADLRKLFINENQLDFQAIPAGIGKLLHLEVFQAAYNNLELVPEGLCRCVKLQRIKLNDNCLVTLPESIHLLADLSELDLRNNPDLVMPPKPAEIARRKAFYNIDFSLEHQLQLAGQSPASNPSSSSSLAAPRDPVARKVQFLRRRRGHAEADSEQRKILQGMSDVVKERERVPADDDAADEAGLQPRRWDENLDKPSIDYSEIFDDDVGQAAGLTLWEMENFLPNLVDEVFHGHFYEADCYIVLHTMVEPSGSLSWLIYYWIGEQASLDKKACAAIHAVNLRNFLGASCRTLREEMNDESDDFLDLFGEEIFYVKGGKTGSGFFRVEEVKYSTRLFRAASVGPRTHFEPVALAADSLDPRFVFLLDAGLQLFVWTGRKARGLLRSKARLFAEKMNRMERKGRADIESLQQGDESERFWQLLLDRDGPPDDPIVEHVSVDFRPRRPNLYQVRLGMGFLELPQVELKHGQLRQNLLNTKCVYILDCGADVFLWIGRKSTRLMRAAGQKLAAQLRTMLHRAEHAALTQVTEATEPMLFKARFCGWDDVIAVDFSRTADSVQRRGADLNVILERDRLRTDLAAFFLERQQEMPDDEATQLMDDCNDDLEYMEPFVLEGKKFVRLPQAEFGSFFTMDCYVFLCRYWVPPDDDADTEPLSSNSASEPNAERTADESTKNDFQCVVYFWQGREASNMGWLTFTFSLQKKFEALFKDKLEVVRMYQQQENHKFLSHFKRRLVIRRGRRQLTLLSGAGQWPELYQMRANGSAICTRTIQVDCRAESLNAAFYFLLLLPFRVIDDDGSRGRVFVWCGGAAPQMDARLADEVAAVVRRADFTVERVDAGAEPDDFWQALGGRRDVQADAEFMSFSRLFRCTNERGYFSVSEKTIDFCQDDLDDDDIMILDNGTEVFLWAGSRSSEVEVKLAYKSVQVYVQHLRLKQPDRPRKLMLALKGKESRRFTKCFHAWGKHKTPAGS